MADNEIIIRARDAASQTLRQVRRDVSQLERELRQATDELERTGQGAARVDQLSRSLERARREATEARQHLAQLNAQVNQATTGANRLQRAWQSTGQAIQRNADKIQKAGLVMAGALGFVGYKAIDAASDLVESQSKTQQVFGDSAQAILDWSKNANKAFGQTQQSALDGASTFAIFGKSAGLSGDQLVSFSTGLVQLSSDMASFYNSSPEEAIEAISAAMRGENDPMEKYGVLLNDAVERQEALRMGLIKTTSQALTPQQRVLVAQSLIMQKTATAQGDFARTSDQLANSQRIAQAELHDTQAEIGQRFLPVALQMTHALSSILGFFDGLPGPVQTTLTVLAALGVAAMIATPRLIAIGQAIGRIRTRVSEAGGLRQSLSGVTSFLGGPWGIALGVATLALGAWVAKNQMAKAKADELSQSIDQQTGAFTENTRQLIAKNLTDDKINGNFFGKGGTQVSDAADQIGLSLANLEDAILGDADAMQKVNTKLDQYKHDAGSAGANAQQLRGYIDQQRKTLDETKDAWVQQQHALGNASATVTDYAAAQQQATTATEDTTDAADAQKQSLQDLADQFDTLAGKTRSMRSAQAALEQSIDDLADKELAKLHPALSKTKKGFDLTTASGRTAEGKLFDVADAAEAAATAAADKGNWGKAKQLINEGRDAIQEQAEKWGMNKTAAKRYADTVLGMPKEISQQIKLDIQAQVEAQAKVRIMSTFVKAPGVLAPVGDTAHPLGVGQGIGHAALAGIHAKIASTVPGVQQLTSTVRGFALGSPDSDHRFGRAYDVAGSNLGQYAERVRAVGGFAELHGSGAGRHLHVVPAPAGRATATVAGRAGGTTTVVHAPRFTFPGVTDESAAARAGAAAAREYTREMDRAAKQRS